MIRAALAAIGLPNLRVWAVVFICGTVFGGWVAAKFINNDRAREQVAALEQTVSRLQVQAAAYRQAIDEYNSSALRDAKTIADLEAANEAEIDGIKDGSAIVFDRDDTNRLRRIFRIQTTGKAR